MSASRHTYRNLVIGFNRTHKEFYFRVLEEGRVTVSSAGMAASVDLKNVKCAVRCAETAAGFILPTEITQALKLDQDNPSGLPQDVQWPPVCASNTHKKAQHA